MSGLAGSGVAAEMATGTWSPQGLGMTLRPASEQLHRPSGYHLGSRDTSRALGASCLPSPARPVGEVGSARAGACAGAPAVMREPRRAGAWGPHLPHGRPAGPERATGLVRRGQADPSVAAFDSGFFNRHQAAPTAGVVSSPPVRRPLAVFPAQWPSSGAGVGSARSCAKGTPPRHRRGGRSWSLRGDTQELSRTPAQTPGPCASRGEKTEHRRGHPITRRCHESRRERRDRHVE